MLMFFASTPSDEKTSWLTDVSVLYWIGLPAVALVGVGWWIVDKVKERRRGW